MGEDVKRLYRLLQLGAANGRFQDYFTQLTSGSVGGSLGWLGPGPGCPGGRRVWAHSWLAKLGRPRISGLRLIQEA